jgi:outer membrane protein assembly factor BamB
MMTHIDWRRMLSLPLLLLSLVSPNRLFGQDWPAFRGADGRGVADNIGLPDHWSADTNIGWRAELPGRGWSSPIVTGERVILTTVSRAEGEPEGAKPGLYFGGNRPKPPTVVHYWQAICLDLASGKQVWKKTLHEGIPTTPRHIKNSYASETPVTDGKNVYVLFGDVGCFCLDLDGNVVWQKGLRPVKTRYGWGTASSPVLHQDRLYIVNDNEDESYLMALDKGTGDVVWRTPREEKSNWATPFIWTNSLRTEIVTPGTGKVRSYDLDGKLLYEFGGCSSITIAQPYEANGLLYVSSGYINDRKRPIFALKPGAKGDITLPSGSQSSPFVAWCQTQGAPYNPSTIVYRDVLYVLHDRGFTAAYDAKTGAEIQAKSRIAGGRSFTASPWAANGQLFFLNEFGTTFVYKVGEKLELTHENQLPEEMYMASPAIAGKRLLIRSDKALYCIE